MEGRYQRGNVGKSDWSIVHRTEHIGAILDESFVVYLDLRVRIGVLSKSFTRSS